MRGGWQRRWAVAWLVAVGACASRGQSVKPDEMGAGQHRQEAQQERQAAAKLEEHAPRVDLEPPVEPPMHTSTPKYAYDPADWHTQQAERLRAHARQHERAAKSLERFEKAECRDIPPSVRAACPLFGPLTKLEDLPNGVRATFAPGTRVDLITAHMRCHFAYAQSRGFDEVLACPLYLRGIEIIRASDPDAVDIVSTDPRVASAIHERSREEASFLRHRTP